MNEAEKQFYRQGQEFQSFAREIMDFVGEGDEKLLDVGCGLGWVVAEADRRGYRALGIDQAWPYVETGRKLLKIDLRPTSLEDFKTKEKFDVVILKHILEHIKNIDPFLVKVNRLLKPGGRVVVACPNIRSLMYWLFRRRWYGLAPGHHVWQFTPSTLTKVLTKNGFSVKKIKVNSLGYNPGGWKGWVFKLLVFAGNITGFGDQVMVLATPAYRKNN